MADVSMKNNSDETKRLERISLYIDGLLNEHEKSDFEKELVKSPELSNELTDMKTLLSDLKNMPEVELPEDFHKTSMNFIRTQMNIKAVEKENAEDIKKTTGIFKFKPSGFKFNFKSMVYAAASTILLFTVIGISSVGLEVLNGGKNGQVNLADPNLKTESADAGVIASNAPALTDAAEVPEKTGKLQVMMSPTVASPPAAVNTVGVDVLKTPDFGALSKDVKSYNVTIEVEDLAAALNRINTMKGYSVVEQVRTESGNPNMSSRNANIMRMVPDADYYNTIFQIRQVGEISEESQSQYSVLFDYNDALADYSARKVEYDRLMKLLGKITQYEEMLMIENQINRVVSQMENLQTNINAWNGQTESPTISIYIYEKAKAAEPAKVKTFGEKVRGAFFASVNAIIKLSQGVLILVAALGLPFLIICAFAIIAFIIYKKTRKGEKKIENENRDKDWNEDWDKNKDKSN